MTTSKDTAESDHDILIEVRTQLKGVIEDIKRLADGTHAQLVDHENRLRSLEKDTVLTTTYGPAHTVLVEEIESIKRYIWMGLGIVSVLVIVINVGIRFIK